MSFRITTSVLGGTGIEFTAETVQETVIQLGFFQSLPRDCPFEGCGAPLAFMDYPAKSADHGLIHYYGMRCLNTAEPHSTNFGEYKDKSKGFFYKGDNEWKVSQVGQKRREDNDYAGPANSSQTNAGASSDPVAAGKLLFENGKVSKTENGYKVGSFEVVRENNMPVCKPPCPDFKNTQKCAHVEAALAFKKANDF